MSSPIQAVAVPRPVLATVTINLFEDKENCPSGFIQVETQDDSLTSKDAFKWALVLLHRQVDGPQAKK